MEMDEDYLRSTSNINGGFNQLLKADTKTGLRLRASEMSTKRGAFKKKNGILSVLPIYHSMSCSATTATTRLLSV